MTYPKRITLENDKLKTLLTEKAVLITSGRAVSEEIETLEKDMADIDVQIQEVEKTVDLTDLHEREQPLVESVNKTIEEMEAIKKEIYARMKEKVPADLYASYEEKDALKKKKEEERNKIALKAQKYNDKIVPLGRKLMKSHLADEFEDYDTLRLEDGVIVCTIFNHLEDFRKNFKK